MRKIVSIAFFCLLFITTVNAQATRQVTEGGLEALGAEGKSLGACPLKNTDVQAEISGFISRVKVTQTFENSFSEKIEAVYVFPLPQNAAVDDMTMRIGERTVRGKILQREEAREVYEAARSNGQIASLLDQERPNIFTQAVANILPGEKIVIEISYVETLKYEDGSYEFVFPMTVGPRYIPGGVTADGAAQVADAQKITPPIAAGRAGHDISISVRVDAGVPLDSVASKTHQIESLMRSASSYDVKLKNEKTIPNKDFVLRYDVAGKKIEDAVLTHRGAGGGYFTLMLQPPDKIDAADVTPKEIVFVLDTSGSMSGFPLEKAKESMKMALEGMNPQDTFNLITFAGDTAVLFKEPVPATKENLAKAQDFLASRKSGGGTEMMKAIKAALDPTDSQQHLRIVCFMTDGYIGNENEILSEIQKHPNARVFSFGIGTSVNRFLLEKMATEGRGEAEFVMLQDEGSAAAKRFHERVRNPLLTDITIDYGTLSVADVYPKRVGDLFSAKPVVIHGRFTQPGSGVIKLKGRSFGRETVREITVNFPENEPAHDVLATLWARTRIDDLSSQMRVTKGDQAEELKNSITNLGIEYRMLTQYTSFVAVEERVVTDGGQPRRIEVPVELPEGVGQTDTPFRRLEVMAGLNRPPTVSYGGGTGAGNGATLQTQTTTVGTTITTRQIKDLPINSRDSLDLTTLAPGTADSRNDRPRNQKPEVKSVYKDWKEKDVAYIITGDGKNTSAGDAKQPAGTVIKAKTLPPPAFPAGVKSTGTINVEVTLDAAGNVISAKAVSGEAAFYQAAETAAAGAKFEVPQIGRDIVKVTGTIVYEFAEGKKVTAGEQLLGAQIFAKPNKYAAVIRAVVERVKANQPAAADEVKFVANGKANVIVRVASLTPETVAALKAAGFEVVAEMASANAVVGRVALEKIAALAEIEAVTFISPQY